MTRAAASYENISGNPTDTFNESGIVGRYARAIGRLRMASKPGSSAGNPAIDSVAEQARSAVDRVADRATGAVNTVKASIHDTVSTVAEHANAASQWASESVDAAKKAPNDLLDAGADYIRARPYAAVAAALAVGYLIGKLR